MDEIKLIPPSMILIMMLLLAIVIQKIKQQFIKLKNSIKNNNKKGKTK